jgi:hypothetical protein
MAYPRVPKPIVAAWRIGGGALFRQEQLGRLWEMKVAANGEVTIPEAAALLQIPRDRLHAWVRAGRFPEGVRIYPDGGSTLVMAMPLVREIYKELYGRYPR